MSALDLAQQLRGRFGEIIAAPAEFRGEISLNVAEPERIAEICSVAKKDLGFDYLVDITGIDNYGDDPRWVIIYHLYGLTHGSYLRLKTNVSEEQSELPTVTTVWRTANWHEREIYDMMGIKFNGHPDLRRILMWEGYPFFPLRKEFPLEGLPSEMPDVAFSQAAPMEGGPFVTQPSTATTKDREPRARRPQL